MIKEEFKFKSADGKTDIYAVKWLPEGEVKAVLQIAHGVTEYILRYEPLAEYLTKKGFVVVGNDHLGHGYSILDDSKKMYFGPDGSWNWAMEDVATCFKLTKEQFPNIPYCILGFSMGSFLARTFLISYPNSVDAAILMGTGQISSINIALGAMMANSEIKKFGGNRTTKKIDDLTFGTYNKIFAPNRTKFDWLCSCEKSLDEYIAEPLRGEAFTAGLFRELLRGMEFSGKIKNIEKMNKNIPVLFISGDKDPVGECGKGVKRAYTAFNKVGMKDVSMKLYPQLRHDILHEENKNEIYEYIYDWMKEKLL